MTQFKTLIIQFENELKRHEIPLFRGAVINTISSNDVLFHNHEGDKYRYSYPLIQYKRIHGKAAIVSINEGAESIGKFFSSCNFSFKIGNRDVEMKIDNITPCIIDNLFNDTNTKYTISEWLPLNSDNYKEYMTKESIIGKVDFLQKILVGNILSFTKGLGIHIEKRIECNITELSESRIIHNKGVPLMSFNVTFTSNINIPKYIGLGKNTSIGYGTVCNK